jgi:hypothetical protein
MRKLTFVCMVMTIAIAAPILAQSNNIQSQSDEWQRSSIPMQVEQLDANTIEIKMRHLPIKYVPYHQGRVKGRTGPRSVISQQQSNDIYETIFNGLNNLKYKYDHNPYITLAGLGLDFAIGPTVTVSIDLKE